LPSKPDANFIWSIANLLRGPYKPKEYGDVVLPLTILRRLDCVLAATKDAVLSEQKRSGDRTAKDLLDVKLRKAAKYSFYNTSPYTLPSLTGDSANIKANLLSYVDGFSDNVRDVFTRFGFEEQVQRLEEANALYLVVQEFAKLDLRPQQVSNTEMGSVFEELIRKFAEASNETAGEHFTRSKAHRRCPAARCSAVRSLASRSSCSNHSSRVSSSHDRRERTRPRPRPPLTNRPTCNHLQM